MRVLAMRTGYRIGCWPEAQYMTNPTTATYLPRLLAFLWLGLLALATALLSVCR